MNKLQAKWPMFFGFYSCCCGCIYAPLDLYVGIFALTQARMPPGRAFKGVYPAYRMEDSQQETRLSIRANCHNRHILLISNDAKSVLYRWPTGRARILREFSSNWGTFCWNMSEFSSICANLAQKNFFRKSFTKLSLLEAL